MPVCYKWVQLWTNFADSFRFSCYSESISSSDRVLLQMPCLAHNRAAGSWSPATSASWVSFQSPAPWNKSVVSPDVNFFAWTCSELGEFPDSPTLSLQKCRCWSKGAGSERSVRLNRKRRTDLPSHDPGLCQIAMTMENKALYPGECEGRREGGRDKSIWLWEFCYSQAPPASPPEHAHDALFSWAWVTRPAPWPPFQLVSSAWRIGP